MLGLCACAKKEEPKTEHTRLPSERGETHSVDSSEDLSGTPAEVREGADATQRLLFIYPRLTARLRGEFAEPMSEPRQFDEADPPFMLGVKLDEGEPVDLGSGRGIAQTAHLDLYGFEPGIERESFLHRFTLRLHEGPEHEPTDDLLIARQDGAKWRVILERRALDEDGAAIEPEGRHEEEIRIELEKGGRWRVERVHP